MNHFALATKFLNGACLGKASNMFIEDDTIYSYGRHFPIAKRLSNNEYLVNSNSYSTSTAKHRSRVSFALRNKITWDCPNCDIDNLPNYIKEKSTEQFNKIQTATYNVKYYLNNLNSYESYWDKCKIRFKLKDKSVDKMFKSFVFTDKVKSKIAKYELINKFIQAVNVDSIEEVTACIKAGVNVTAKANIALERSIRDHVDMTKLLLDNGAKITDSGMRAAIWRNFPATVKLLLEYGAKIRSYEQFNYIKENIELTNEIKGKLLEFELDNNSRK